MHAIDTNTENVALSIWRDKYNAALLISGSDLEGQVAYLLGPDIMKTVMTLCQIYNEIHTNRKAAVSFFITDSEDDEC